MPPSTTLAPSWVKWRAELPGTLMSSYGRLRCKPSTAEDWDLRLANSAFNELKQVVAKLL